jgi:hypothetical protein
MDMVPVVFGSGKRYFGSIDGSIYRRILTWSSRVTGCYT